jgi:hypothetical protein
MLYEESDKRLFKELEGSLNKFCYSTKAEIYHKPFPKSTGSLYRFGWFYINGYKYSVSGWKFKDGLVTFENEDTHEKVKYSITDNMMRVGEFKKDGIIEKYVKLLRRKLSKILKELSDKLYP